MKKFLFIIMSFFFCTLNVSASDIPKNIYYINDGLYAYLENNQLELEENQKLYIEYRINNNEEVKNLDLIEVKKNQNTIFLTDLIENLDEIQIDSRFVLYGDNYVYLDWSEKGSITNFDFKDKPLPIISNLKYNGKFTYNIINKEEIETYFATYKKIYNLEITYNEEYRYLEKWSSKIPENPNNINFRINYEIGSVKSDYSNILSFNEVPKTCMFDSSFCCNQILNVSVCIWFIVVFSLFTILLIFIDYKQRLKKEA